MCLPRQHAELPTQTPLWDGASRSTQTGGGASHCSGVFTYTRGRNRRRIRVAHCCSRGAWRPGDRPELWNKFRAKITPRLGLVGPQPAGPPRCSHMWPAGLGPVQRRRWQVWSSVRLTSVSPPVQRGHLLVDLKGSPVGCRPRRRETPGAADETRAPWLLRSDKCYFGMSVCSQGPRRDVVTHKDAPGSARTQSTSHDRYLAAPVLRMSR